MRHVPEGLRASIAGGAATLCHVWIVERADGVRLGFTDHDRALSVDGVVCSAESGWTAGASETGLGFSAGSLSAEGALEGLDEAALAEGLFDGAAVELWRVDWRTPADRVRLWRGRIARVVRSGGGFTAEVEGPLALLERVVGRTYARRCDATLGDARCGVDLGGLSEGTTCDKRWATCTGVFANGLNFRGFPDIPGDDFITARPRETEARDGGSRRS